MRPIVRRRLSCYRGVRIESPFAQYGSRPALLVASVEAHGTALLARAPELPGALVEWFQRTLGGSKIGGRLYEIRVDCLCYCRNVFWRHPRLGDWRTAGSKPPGCARRSASSQGVG